MLASTIPTCLSYDPAYVYEMAVIMQDGMRRMYEEGEDCFYYITMYNEDYAMPAMPEGEGIQEGILRGIYKFKAAESGKAQAQLFGSGADSERGAARAGDSGGEIQHCRRCVERDQLQRAAARCAATSSAGTGCIPARNRRHPIL